MTENEQIASGVLAALENSGGRPSLLRAYNCMTRLRLSFDEVAGIPDGLADAVAGLPSVLGTNVSGTELQIILGPGKAANVTAALNKLLAASKPAAPSEKEAPADDRPQIGDGKALHAKIRAKNATPVKLFFIACGLISGCLNVVAKVAPDVTTGPLFQLLAIAGSTVFFGMNLLVGRNTMEEFGGTPVLGAILGALLSHPNLAHVTLNGETLVPGRGGIISVLLVAMLASVIEKQVKRFVPEALSLFVTPLVTFLVSGTIAILVLQPVGGALSDLIGNTATGAIAAGGALTGAVLGGTFLPMVMLGIHQTLTPIHAELLARYGVTILLPVLAMAGAGQVGASFAVWCRTKNTRLKKIIASALPVGILGIGEPLIYGVTLPLGRPFLGACIGGFVATLVTGFDDPVETANADSSSERV